VVEQVEVVRVDREIWALRQEAIKPALDLLQMAYNVTIDISEIQYDMIKGFANVNLTFAGDPENTLAASVELSKVNHLLPQCTLLNGILTR
jgi:hypothetical protein